MSTKPLTKDLRPFVKAPTTGATRGASLALQTGIWSARLAPRVAPVVGAFTNGRRSFVSGFVDMAAVPVGKNSFPQTSIGRGGADCKEFSGAGGPGPGGA